MTSYRDTLRYLYGLEYRGMKFGLRNIRMLVREAGHPERRFPSVHVAGTNGKGSTSAFLASAFAEAGYRTGLYTSPHLVRFTERIRINGREIEERRLVDYVRALRPSIERCRATFFEATTCVAFLYFADEDVDVAVIETGLGGRLDATNVLRPLIAVVTNISRDHTALLGNNVRAIAREKAGIFKRSVPAVTGETDPAPLGVFRRRAAACGVRLCECAMTVSLAAGRGRRRIRLSSPRLALRPFELGLPGAYQRRNAALALCVLDRLLGTRDGKRLFRRLDSSSIRRAFIRVRENTGMRGRFERLGGRPPVLLDVAHNPAGVRTLAEELKNAGAKNLIAVFGVMRDKEYLPMLSAVGKFADRVIAVAPAQKRALSAESIVREGRRIGITVINGGSVASGVRKAARFRGKTIVITGSHYVVGEALTALGREIA